MSSRRFAVFVALTTSLLGAARAQWPARAQSAPILLRGATVHTVSGAPVKDGQVLIVEGKIAGVGKKLEVPHGTREIDLEGKHVYPGLIAANTLMGLTEIGSVRATRDYAEVGEVTPEARAEVAFHPDSKLILVARMNGITLAASVPQSGLISGTSALMMMDGWTWEDMTLKAPLGVHVRWPSMHVAPGEGAAARRKQRDGALRTIQDTFRDARHYLTARRAGGGERQEVDRRLEALVPAVERRIPVMVHADELRAIQAACAWARAEDLRLVIVGGRDAWRATELLKACKAAVIAGGVHRLPGRRHSGYDEPFALPARLHRAGVPFCIAGGDGASDTTNARNLPYHAATAAAYGLPKDVAVRSITLSAAEVLGVADRVGSIEKGKDATLIVTDGDPLEITTRVEIELIQGREVDLDSHHEQLNRRYLEKYRRLGLLRK